MGSEAYAHGVAVLSVQKEMFALRLETTDAARWISICQRERTCVRLTMRAGEEEKQPGKEHVEPVEDNRRMDQVGTKPLR